MKYVTHFKNNLFWTTTGTRHATVALADMFSLHSNFCNKGQSLCHEESIETAKRINGIPALYNP